jgi:hypothetical protein
MSGLLNPRSSGGDRPAIPSPRFEQEENITATDREIKRDWALIRLGTVRGGAGDPGDGRDVIRGALAAARLVSMSPSPIPPVDAWPRLRSRAYAVVARLLARALPAALAASEGLITRLERRVIIAWIRPLEAVVRTLIFGEILSWSPPPAVPPPRQRSTAPSGARASGGGDGGSGGGGRPPGLAFNLGLGVVLGGGGRGQRVLRRPAPRKDDLGDLISVRPLVQRFDAVLGALEDPAPHVARAGRRLGLVPPAAPRRLAGPPAAAGCAPIALRALVGGRYAPSARTDPSDTS